MSCPNCKLFQHLCKAGCCSYVPISKEVWERNQDKIHTQPKEVMDIGGGVILPITASGSCPFLAQDLSCSIYDERPEVCRLFGNETHLNLTCSYQKTSGDARSFHERKKIEKKQTKSVEKYAKNNSKHLHPKGKK